MYLCVCTYFSCSIKIMYYLHLKTDPGFQAESGAYCTETTPTHPPNAIKSTFSKCSASVQHDKQPVKFDGKPFFMCVQNCQTRCLRMQLSYKKENKAHVCVSVEMVQLYERSEAKVMDSVRLISNLIAVNCKAPQTPLAITLHHSKELKSGDLTGNVNSCQHHRILQLHK